MMNEMDELDKKIVHYICSGVYSYSDLAELCNVGRNTIYRRIDKLEKMGIITKRIMAVPNFGKLNLSAVIVGLDVSLEDMERTVDFLKKQDQVKFMWKTYGAHDLVFTIICNKGEVGNCIYALRKGLENLKVRVAKFDVSPSISWEKFDVTPY